VDYSIIDGFRNGSCMLAKNILAIASGKGGVGKSTTAVNLALALLNEGFQTGILDADIYGPSVPLMLGIHDRPRVTEQKKMHPMIAHGIQSMSIGYLVDEKTPMVWRGPMVTGALMQLLNDTLWDNLDYLIIDLPPGTGDIQLTLTQKIPLTGAIIVTTPQDLALLDARRAYEMFRKVNVPVLGVIENMSLHVCSKCGHEEPIFGEGGGKQMAEQYGIPFLGALPLDIHIRQETDSGKPTVAANPKSANANLYREIAKKIAAGFSQQEMSQFPKIIIQND
jgi:ATP-binding protein involved in chromosome partitioning